MLCLQQKLVPVALGEDEQVSTCPAVREFAFSTHPKCYIEGGVCLLPPTDWLVIVGTVGFTELFDSIEALAATLKTVKGCLDFLSLAHQEQFHPSAVGLKLGPIQLASQLI